MSCIAHGGLRGVWGTMFQNGQDCPNVFGCEPIKRILQDRDMEYKDKFNELLKEVTGLLGLAKQVMSDPKLERCYASGSAMDYDLGRPD
eukprot:9190457-Pyramimonas_sp.AAC.1